MTPVGAGGEQAPSGQRPSGSGADQVAGPVICDPAVAVAAKALSRGVPVGEVSSTLGMLPRTLRRRFIAQVGLTPKRFARVQRLQRVVRQLDGETQADWAAVAAEHGYSDQPHLAGEFRDLAGVTPGEYLRSRIDGPNHLRLPTVPDRSAEGSRHCRCAVAVRSGRAPDGMVNSHESIITHRGYSPTSQRAGAWSADRRIFAAC